jgi:4-hydroxybenzoyl-CoA thioesterase
MSVADEVLFGASTPGFPKRFHHCDPAGIAFFGRLDELINSAFEDWCEAVGMPIAISIEHERIGFPLVYAAINYTGALRLGDRIVIGHHLRALGRTSLTFDLTIHVSERECLSGSHVRVLTSLDTTRPIEIPDHMRLLLRRGAE